jgi:hypothetical protein
MVDIAEYAVKARCVRWSWISRRTLPFLLLEISYLIATAGSVVQLSSNDLLCFVFSLGGCPT